MESFYCKLFGTYRPLILLHFVEVISALLMLPEILSLSTLLNRRGIAQQFLLYSILFVTIDAVHILTKVFIFVNVNS